MYRKFGRSNVDSRLLDTVYDSCYLVPSHLAYPQYLISCPQEYEAT